jgi:hypothetical protein
LAAAQTLPQATVSLYANGEQLNAFGTLEYRGAEVTATPGFDPTISVSAGGYANVSGLIYYYFTIAGPSGPVQVQYSATGSSGTNTNVNQGTAGFSIFPSAGDTVGLIVPIVGLTTDTNDNNSFSVNNASATLQTGTTYVEQISADILSFGPLTYSGTASIDPTISLTPTEIADGYKLQFSSNISPVPEPSSAALAFSGLLFLSAVWARRSFYRSTRRA